MIKRKFGQIQDQEIVEIEIASEGARAKIINWGATLRDLEIAWLGGWQKVVTGLNRIEDYQAYSSHMGAIAGRFANRIAGGRFELEGKTYQLPQNAAGASLHGGGEGFGRRVWSLAAFDAHSVTLSLCSPDGDAGYPGNVNVSCVYSLKSPAILRIELTATTDQPTIINLAHHSYFNLDGSDDILDQRVEIFGRFRTPTDANLIPTGAVEEVRGTCWDFTTAQPIGARQTLYDSTYLIDSQPDQETGLAYAARLYSAKNLLSMQVWTSEPAVQFYDGAKLNIPVEGLDGVRYGAHAGVCFEPQHVPDSPHFRHFPSAVLRPHQMYRQITEYRFG